MHIPADAVADQLPHHPVAVGFRVGLYGPGNVADAIPGPGKLEPFKEAFPGDPDQLLHRGVHLPDQEGAGGVPVKPIQLGAYVHADDVSLLEPVMARDPVDHLLVHRGADALWVSVIMEEGRGGALAADVFLRSPVQLQGAYPGFRQPAHQGQRPLYHPSCGLHLLDVRRVLDGHHASFSSRAAISADTTSMGWLPFTV